MRCWMRPRKEKMKGITVTITIPSSSKRDQKESEMQALKQQVAELLKLAKAQNVINDKKNDRSSQERARKGWKDLEGSFQGLLVLDHRLTPQVHSEGSRGQSSAMGWVMRSRNVPLQLAFRYLGS